MTIAIIRPERVNLLTIRALSGGWFRARLPSTCPVRAAPKLVAINGGRHQQLQRRVVARADTRVDELAGHSANGQIAGQGMVTARRMA